MRHKGDARQVEQVDDFLFF